MEADFLRIAITLPEEVEDEGTKIKNLLLGTIDRVHIRKPGWTVEKLESLLEAIPQEFHSRLVLHDHHRLVHKFGVGGIHLNSRNRAIVEGVPFSVSCHSVGELEDFPGAEYCFLSPIYDSISKPGYVSRFTLGELAPRIKGKRVVALGGVTPDKFSELREAGFIGGAMMGAAWME